MPVEEMNTSNIEVCFSPTLFPSFRNSGAIAVITDILRASSAIVTAFENGVERIIPVGTLEEAKEYKEKGFMVAAERDGIVRDFADFGNSPFNFTKEKVEGQEIVYSTTNGTTFDIFHQMISTKDNLRPFGIWHLSIGRLVDYHNFFITKGIPQ